MTSKVVAGVAAAVLSVGVAASGQSLGDVAKQEEARRKVVKGTGKVYTNESLHSEPPPSSVPATPGAVAAATTPADKPAAATAAADDVKDETAWKKKIADARTALDRSQQFAEALQTRINSLTTDFTNRDDPAQRAQIGTDRDKALAELNRLKKEIEDETKAIANIQEDARKAGVPAGWVR